MTVEELALGFVHVANESMCRPIRNISEGRGFSASSHALACFGGAGGQHACAIARTLGMKIVFVHRFAGILSAYGIGVADTVEDVQSPLFAHPLLASDTNRRVEDAFVALEKQASAKLMAEGFAAGKMSVRRYLNLRFSGTDTAMMISDCSTLDEYRKRFEQEYVREFGFLLQNREILVDDVRVRVNASSGALKPPVAVHLPPAQPFMVQKCYFSHLGFVETPVFRLREIGLDQVLNGPAIIVDDTNTILLEPGCEALCLESSLKLTIGKEVGIFEANSLVDNVLLSVFAHRFMSIAEQMGRTLQRTSVSTNIKERKDFSCALFGPTGGLVANAPHLPVHLGSMQDAIRWQIQHLGDTWKEGYVVCTNHPDAGGTHLPDITVITPVFAASNSSPNDRKPVFYVASRGHHADIGGISPGSMPPFSTYLEEEGAAIHSFFLVKDGVFDEKGITAILEAPGKQQMKYSQLKSSGTRDLKNNLSDLAAQVAANQKGISLMHSLIQEFGLEVVLSYMQHVQDNCELAVRDLLRQVVRERKLAKGEPLRAVDYMDDGSKIALAISIDEESGSALFDFSGTSSQVHGNTNAPRSITYSAIIYSLRCLVDRDIPLNQGVMAGIRVVIPSPSILSPSSEVGVVGGNVLTSQRLTDVILYAFGAAANSQGDMSNLTFGGGASNASYYETICGGSGAGPSWEGQSCVQCHMTNTACTDVEILERRFPVRLRQFAVRHGSGGAGLHRGGDGVVRELEFCEDGMSVGILSERRALAPHGLNGGGDAERGKNTLLFKDGRVVSLGPKNEIRVGKGDRIRIETPGGGGWGQKGIVN